MTVTALPSGWLAPAGWWSRLSRAARFHPEWSAAAVMVLAWVAFAIHGLSGHHETAGHHLGNRVSVTALSTWALMTVAMTMPGCLPAVRHVALNSLHRRRWRATTLLLSSYFATWVVFGAVVLSAVAAARERYELAATADGDPLLVGALAVAAVWQLTARKRRFLRACHRSVPLPPRGWQADSASVRFGLRQARTCMGSCWALMVVMAVAGHENLAWMVALSALVAAERLTRTGRRLVRPSGALLAAVAIVVALLT